MKKNEIMLKTRINEFKVKLEKSIIGKYVEEDIREYLINALLKDINMEIFDRWDDALCKMNIDAFEAEMGNKITGIITRHKQSLEWFYLDTEELRKHLATNLMGFYAFSQCVLFIDPSEKANVYRRMHK